MTIVRIILAALCFLAATVVQARMYQWQDPDTGTTYFSGTPPSWYRTDEPGPRVVVFEKGRIIDDTSIRLSGEASDELRLRAIARAEEDREIARQKAMAAEELKAMMESSESEDLMTLDMPVETTETVPEPDAIAQEDVILSNMEGSPGLEGLTTEQMRALILQWELEKTEQAKREIYNNGNP